MNRSFKGVLLAIREFTDSLIVRARAFPELRHAGAGSSPIQKDLLGTARPEHRGASGSIVKI